VPNEDLRLLIDALILQNATGGDLIPVLEMLVATVRQRMQLRREVRALTAQGRVSSYVLALLPVFVGGALVMLDPIDMSFFWTSLLGGALLMVALIGMAIGFMLIQRIVAVRL
jgi:tight adherence protein B